MWREVCFPERSYKIRIQKTSHILSNGRDTENENRNIKCLERTKNSPQSRFSAHESGGADYREQRVCTVLGGSSGELGGACRYNRVVGRRTTNPILRAHPLYEHPRHLARRNEQEIHQAWENFPRTTSILLALSVHEEPPVQLNQ